MSDERDTTEDLPDDIVRMLRDVAPAGTQVRETHIAAALAEIAPAGRSVVRVDFRRRMLLSAAAAVMLVLAAGAGWAARGSGTDAVVAPASADMSSSANEAAVPATDAAAPAKGATYAGPTATGSFTTVPPCTDKVDPDAVYVGEYTDKDTTYLVFRQKQALVFVDKTTCAQVLLSAVTTAP